MLTGTCKGGLQHALHPARMLNETHHLPQLRLKVSLLHTQLLIGLDHLTQLFFPLLAFLQLVGGGGGEEKRRKSWLSSSSSKQHMILELPDH